MHIPLKSRLMLPINLNSTLLLLLNQTCNDYEQLDFEGLFYQVISNNGTLERLEQHIHNQYIAPRISNLYAFSSFLFHHFLAWFLRLVTNNYMKLIIYIFYETSCGKCSNVDKR